MLESGKWLKKEGQMHFFDKKFAHVEKKQYLCTRF